jgi:ubiquinone/menaquinone biosynthesis C-methylase UbiE
LVVGVDRRVSALYTAKKWIAPGAEFVCGDADADLPFREEAFSAVLCSDAFHYFADKGRSAREIKRVIHRDGLIMLAAMRNELVPVPNAGQPLTPARLSVAAG